MIPAKRTPHPAYRFHAQAMVSALFHAGHSDVILDSVSHTEKTRAEWSKYNCVFHEVRTRELECLRRAVLTNQQYLGPVIQQMAKEITWPSEMNNN